MSKCIKQIFEVDRLLQQNKKFENLKQFCEGVNKLKKKKKRLKPNDLIKKAAEIMNNIISPKYGVAPKKTQQKSLDANVGEFFGRLKNK